MSNSTPALPVLAAAAGSRILRTHTLAECFGKLIEFPLERLRDLPGKPQQVMLAQTLYYLKTTVPLDESLRADQSNFDKLVSSIDIAERRRPKVIEPVRPVAVPVAVPIADTLAPLRARVSDTYRPISPISLDQAEDAVAFAAMAAAGVDAEARDE